MTGDSREESESAESSLWLLTSLVWEAIAIAFFETLAWVVGMVAGVFFAE